MKTTVLKINWNHPEKNKIALASSAIRSGGIVVFPTETVYGIGANAMDASACKKIYKVKGRRSDNPLIVHVSSMAMADKIAVIPKKYRNQIKSSWPGPITFVVKAKEALPRTVTGGLDTVAVRMPRCRIALDLINAAGVPIAAPSANISKKPSSTKAEHALKYFMGKVPIIISSGDSRYGVESTVLDLETFEILRPGAFTTERIKSIFGKAPRAYSQKLSAKSPPRSPGMKYRHYSPSTPLFAYAGNSAAEINKITSGMKNFCFIGSSESCRVVSAPHKISLGSRSDKASIARNLFAALIDLDELDVKFCIIERFGKRGIGEAIANRIEKATNHRSFCSRGELEAFLH
jgi:L-threonylcarbamoyladenylate synthase